MLRNIVVAGLMGVAFTGAAFAQGSCSCAVGTRLNINSIVTALGGKTVCAVLGAESWKEFHTGATASGGALIETGRTPAENVGTWSATGAGSNSIVTYNYGTGGSFSYEVCSQGALTHFCGVKNVTNATLVSGQGGCP